MHTLQFPFSKHSRLRMVLPGLVLACGIIYLALAYTTLIYASGTTIVVNSLADNSTTDSSCTLREAILTANLAPANADCGANNGAPYTIGFNVSGTIAVTPTLPSITQNLTIDGSGQSVTVSGSSGVRVMNINGGKNVTVQYITISDGSSNAGAGIYNNGTLTVSHATFSNNQVGTGWGGALYNNGTLFVSDSTFSGNTSNNWGGAIYNGTAANATVNHSTFSTNHAGGWGGGIFNSATLTVTASIFDGNTGGTIGGGGIYNGTGATLVVDGSTFSNNNISGGGGGIFNYTSGNFTITASVFFSNTAANHGGGILNYGTGSMVNTTLYNNNGNGYGGNILNSTGALTFTNATLSDGSATHGGGIYNMAALSMTNTIIANSTSGGDCNNTGTIGANVDNLIEDNSCSPTLSGDPSLDVLADNGGATQSMALLGGSTAINAGDNTTCLASPVNNLDQRGYVRVTAGNTVCDIGAYEANSAGLPTNTPTLTPTITNTPTATDTPTNTPTKTTTPTITNTPTNTVTPTRTPTITLTPPPSSTPTITVTPTTTSSPAPAADLNLLKTVKKSGTNHKYTLKVNNAGTLAAANVVIQDKLPKKYVISQVKGGKATCTISGRKVTCKLSTLNVGGKNTITIIAAPHGASGQNCATTTTGTLDSNPANNTSCVAVPDSTTGYRLPSADTVQSSEFGDDAM